ncbi:hypothetical protein EVAR_14265_1 [Eumeta japonica]|uniref:Uncharacterized protein n=1 Tax=Eumeta variegata TaxID=151549 RepID=A0A4C1W9L5_EUMVA|nr:hypothetical protein EVAR_14265_1 [Eumeta japonica]
MIIAAHGYPQPQGSLVRCRPFKKDCALSRSEPGGARASIKLRQSSRDDFGNSVRLEEGMKIKLDAVYKENSTSIITVRYLFNEFERGRVTVSNEERPGRPSDVFTEEIVEKVHEMTLSGRQTKMREGAKESRKKRQSRLER